MSIDYVIKLNIIALIAVKCYIVRVNYNVLQTSIQLKVLICNRTCTFKSRWVSDSAQCSLELLVTDLLYYCLVFLWCCGSSYGGLVSYMTLWLNYTCVCLYISGCESALNETLQFVLLLIFSIFSCFNLEFIMFIVLIVCSDWYRWCLKLVLLDVVLFLCECLLMRV